MKTFKKVLKATVATSSAVPLVLSMFFVSLLFFNSYAAEVTAKRWSKNEFAKKIKNIDMKGFAALWKYKIV